MPDSHFPLLPSDLLDRYLAGMATPAEVDQVHEWLHAYPDGASLLAGLTSSAVTDQSPTSATEREVVWQRIANATQPAARSAHLRGDAWAVHTPTGRRAVRHRMGSSLWPRWGGAFAALTLVVFAVIGIRVQQMTSRHGDHPLTQYATRAGERAQITLADGTHAILGPLTTLQVSTTAGATTVVVQGEALFTVIHSANTPFIVRTRQSITQVLGTTFAVRQYAADRVARVIVAQGRVAVRGVRHTAVGSLPAIADNDVATEGVLAEGAVAVVGDSGQVTVMPGISLREYTGWTTGELVFRAAAVRDVVADLARTYNVTIRIADSTLASRQVDWTVQSARYSLSQVLPELLLMLNAHAQERDGVITVVPGRTASQRGAGTRSLLAPEWQYGR